MAQHTQGPWAVEVLPSGRVTVTAGEIFVAGDECDMGLDMDDARLIAASPAMLKLLKEARERIEQNIKSLIESHTVPSTGLLEAEAVLAVEAEQDFLNQIDEVISKAET